MFLSVAWRETDVSLTTRMIAGINKLSDDCVFSSF